LLGNEYTGLAVANAQALTPTLGGNNSAVPSSNFGFDLTGATNAAGANATPTTQQAITSPVTAPTYHVAGTPSADVIKPIGAHNQNFALGAQMATANPALAAIASQRAGFSQPSVTPQTSPGKATTPNPTASGTTAPPVT
jgi:hypothetical protein